MPNANLIQSQPFNHFLVGPPGSGKSTVAASLQALIPSSCVISTDVLRAELYGDASIQGDWPEIETALLEQIAQLIRDHVIIYDATNAKRAWRLDLLNKLRHTHPESEWVAWHLTTSINLCQQWNQNRDRQVPPDVVRTMYEQLQTFVPHVSEGFVAVHPLNPVQSGDLSAVLVEKLITLNRSQINRRNRTRNLKQDFHPYSSLISFERLIYLINVLIQNPGLGNLRYSQPEQLTRQQINLLEIKDDIDEIHVLIARKFGAVYADLEAIRRDLSWLDENGFFGLKSTTDLIRLSSTKPPETASHFYSDSATFLRLMSIIRFISHQPFYRLADYSNAQGLAIALSNQGILPTLETHNIRKDIELILKPYKLLPDRRLRSGYFFGTGIFNRQQLQQIQQILAAHAKQLEDPLALQVLQTCQERLQRSDPESANPYPVRAIYNRTIVDTKLLPHGCLSNTISQLELEIEQGQLLELQRYPGVGNFSDKPNRFFQAWPLQIVFHNIAWYLGYEIVDGVEKGLLQFERLDRLFRGRSLSIRRDRMQQERSLHRLQRLCHASGGLYLGCDQQMQKQFLSRNQESHQAASLTLELWFTDKMFRFVREGTQRFPVEHMQMSRESDQAKLSVNPKLFCLGKSPDPDYSNRFRVQLPKWSLDNIELRRWIFGFGYDVKVIEPIEYRAMIYELATAIAQVNQSDRQ